MGFGVAVADGVNNKEVGRVVAASWTGVAVTPERLGLHLPPGEVRQASAKSGATAVIQITSKA
jgi:hypothetical protein